MGIKTDADRYYEHAKTGLEEAKAAPAKILLSATVGSEDYKHHMIVSFLSDVIQLLEKM